MKTRIFAAILALAMALTLLPTVALAVVDDEFTVSDVGFMQNGGSLSVRFKVLTEDAAAGTGTVQVGVGDGPAADNAIATANIPATVTNGGITYRVTAIGDKAFLSRVNLASVSIPDSVTAIGEAAFKDCGALASVHIPGSVTSIGENAFQGCTRLASVYIARPTAPEVGRSAFGSINANAMLYIPMNASGYDGADWSALPREKQVQCPLVSGTVKDSSGNPIAGATVSLDGVNITTNASGHYEFFPVNNGNHNVTAGKSGYANKDVTATVENTNATDADITLLARNAVTVTNGDGDGNYTEGATVTVTADAPASNKRFKEWTGADSLTFTDGTSKTSATAKFTMPASAVAVTATYMITLEAVLTSGSATFTVGTATQDAVFTIGAGIDGFGIGNYDYTKVGNTTLNASQVTAANGSIVLTFNKAYLDTLSVGAHTATVYLKGGAYAGATVALRFVVTAPGGAGGDTDVPKTGDGSMPYLWAGLALLAGAGLLVLKKRRAEKMRG